MASKAIKGITIEINGDATKLDKALRSVDTTINEVQSDLRGVDRALKLDPGNVVLLEQKEKLLEQAAEAARKKHETLAEALKQAGKDGSATQEQLDALTRETEEAAVAAKEAEKRYAEFSPTLKKTAVDLQRVGDAANDVAEKTNGLSIGAAAVVAGLGAMAVSAANAADEIGTLAQQTGFSVEFIQQAKYASELVDVSVDSITGAFTKLKKNLDSGSSSVTDAFTKIGVNVGKLKASGASMDEIFMLVVNRLGYVSDELERDNLAMTLFGKSADQLAGIIDDGGAAFKAYGEEAESMGLILGDDAMDGALKFSDAMEHLKAIAEQSVLAAGAALLEKLTPAIEAFLHTAERILLFLSKIPAPILIITGVLAGLIALISPVARLIHSITGAITGVSAVGKIFSEGVGNSVFLTFTKWALVIVGVVAAITALIAVIGALTGKGEAISATVNSLSDYTSGQVGNVTRMPRAQGYASGGVFEPNTPMLIGVGDNTTEREVLAPRSELISAYEEAMRRYGGAGVRQNVTIRFDGDLAQLGRVLEPTITAATAQRGKVV